MTWSWNSQIPCGNADEETIRSFIVSRNEGGVEPDCELRLGAGCALDRLSFPRSVIIRKWQTISEFSILSSVKEHWRRDGGASKSSCIYSWFLRSISSANRRDHDLNEHCSITGVIVTLYIACTYVLTHRTLLVTTSFSNKFSVSDCSTTSTRVALYRS